MEDKLEETLIDQGLKDGVELQLAGEKASNLDLYEEVEALRQDLGSRLEVRSSVSRRVPTSSRSSTMQRGRKNSFEVVVCAGPVMPGDGRPLPPSGLSEAEAAIWRDYVDEMPLNWFGRESYAMLRLLCRHTVVCERLSQELVELGPGLSSRNQVKELTRLIEREAKIMTSLAWQLRLTPKSREIGRAHV